MKVSIKFLFTRSFAIFTAIFCIILASATVKAANTRVKVVKKNGLLKSFLKTKALQRQKFDPTFLLKSIKPEVLSTFVNKHLTGELGMKHRDMEVVKASVPVLIKALKGGQIEEHDLNDLRNISNGTANTFMTLSKVLPVFNKAMPILNRLGRSFKKLGGKQLKTVEGFMPVLIALLQGKRIEETDLTQLKKNNPDTAMAIEYFQDAMPLLRSIGEALAHLGKSKTSYVNTVLQSIHRLASKIDAHVYKYFNSDPGKILRDEKGKDWLIKQFTNINNTCEKEQLLKQWDTKEEMVLEEYLINKTNKVISDEKKFNKLYTYDWNKVAKHVTTGTGKTRTAKDCQIKVEGCPDTGLLTYIIGAKNMNKIQEVFDVTAQIKKSEDFKKMAKDLQKVEQTAETSHNTMNQVVKSLDKVTAKVDETKDISEGLLSPLRRAWQTQKIRRDYHDSIKDNIGQNTQDRRGACKKEFDFGMTVVNAVELTGEVDVTKCMLRNRDEMIEEFCNFKEHIDEMLIQGKVYKVVDGKTTFKTATDYFPNICCDKSKICDRSEYHNIQQKDIVPFALVAGGKLTYDNLYDEVKRTMEVDGYIHKGIEALMAALNHMNHISNTEVKGLRNDAKATLATMSLSDRTESLAKNRKRFFQNINFCGPRIFSNPTTQDASGNYMCQLFVPYRGLMPKLLSYDTYHFIGLYVKKLDKMLAGKTMVEADDKTALIEKASTSIEKMFVRQHAEPRQLSKEHHERQHNLAKVLSSKTKSKAENAEPVCKKSESTPKVAIDDIHKSTDLDSLARRHWENKHCSHAMQSLDLNNPKSQHFGIYFVKKWMNLDVNDYDFMSQTQNIAKYQITDDCTVKTIQAKDISLQPMNSTQGSKHKLEWAFIAKLNTNDPKGYFQKYLTQCAARDYYTKTDFNVKLFVDTNLCCRDNKDADACDKTCKLAEMAVKCNHGNDKIKKRVGVKADFNLEGALYSHTPSVTGACSAGRNRRGLLQSRSQNAAS